MSTVPAFSFRSPTGNPAIEQTELRDFGGVSGLPDDPSAEMDAAFGYGTPDDELTEREIDALFVEDMERRDREAAEVVSGDGDGDKPRPAGGAVRPCPADYTDAVAKYDDSVLVEAAAMIDSGTAGHGSCWFMELHTEEQRQAWLAAAADELLRRLSQMREAA